MNTKAIVIASALGVSTLVGLLVTANAAPAPVGPGSAQTTVVTTQPVVTTEPAVSVAEACLESYADDGIDLSASLETSHYSLTSYVGGGAADDCAAEWAALIDAKDKYIDSITDLNFIGSCKTLWRLGKARTAAQKCCKGKEKQTSCAAAIDFNWLY